MKKLLTDKEVENFKTDGAIVLRKKFDISWIEKLKLEHIGYKCVNGNKIKKLK